jgi:small-conductance mechanosensitive channel
MTTGIKSYISFVACAGICLVGLMFYLEPTMIIPSVIGLITFSALIVLQMMNMEKKSEKSQKSIAIRNGGMAAIMIVAMIVGFFYSASEHLNVPPVKLARLWFGF